MIFGKRRTASERVTPAVMAGLMLLTTTTWADENRLDMLMQALSRHTDRHAVFTESHAFALARTPLLSSGTLAFHAPDHLEKITRQPVAESLILDGPLLSLTREGHRPRTLALEDYPQVAGFIEGLRGILQGNRSTLEQHYQLHLEGYPGPWILTMTPTDPALQPIFKNLIIHGDDDDIHEIHIVQQDGDRSDMIIHATP